MSVNIADRLRRTRLSPPNIHGGVQYVPLNPDGPEAADKIDQLVEGLKEAVTALTCRDDDYFSAIAGSHA